MAITLASLRVDERNSVKTGAPVTITSVAKGSVTNVTTRRFPFLTCPSDQENAPLSGVTNFNYVVSGGNGGTYGSAGPAPTPTGYTVMAGMFNGSNLTKKVKLTDVTDD